jgi:hypothetical protein
MQLAGYIAIPALFALLPTPYIESLPGVCIFRHFFGFECPGCGMTRALSALVHGDLAAALRFNRSVLVVFPLLCYVVTAGIWKEVKNSVMGETSANERNSHSLVYKEGTYGSKKY